MRDTRNWKKNEKNIADLNSLYTDSPSIESSDSDLKGVSGTQTTSWRNVNYAISQLRCEVWFTLGKQKIPAIPNSADVRVGDKLKVVQFHPVIRNNSTPSPKIINFGWHQLGVLWIRITYKQMFAARKRYENWVSEQAAGGNRGVLCP